MASRSVLLTTAIGVVLAMAPGTAWADDEGEKLEPVPPATAQPAPAATPTGIIGDTVYLRNGGLMRGTVHEIVPGDHVTILGPSGQLSIVRWTDVDRVELGNRPRAALPAPAAVTVPVVATSAKPGKKGPMARLHIESKRTVQVYRQASQENGWYEACSSPCDEDMPLNDEYRISGPGILQSRDFKLDGAPGSRIIVNVDPSYRSTIVIGSVLAAVGGLVDYIGLLVAATGAAASHTYCPTSSSYYSSASYSSSYSCSSGDRDTGAIVVGAGMLNTGTAMMATGIVIMIANSSTGISQTESSTSAAKLPLDAYKREAMWHTPTTAAPAATPLVSFPLLSRSF